MKKRSLGIKTLVLGMTLVFASMISGCGDKASDSASKNEKTETTTETTTEDKTPLDGPNGTQDINNGSGKATDYSAYCGYWVSEETQTFFYIDADYTWYVASTVTGEGSDLLGVVTDYGDYITLTESSGEKIYTNFRIVDSIAYDDYGNHFNYMSNNPMLGYSDNGDQNGNDTVHAMINDGIYYMDGNLSAESYIRIKGTEFEMYYRSAGEEPMLVEEGYYTDIDDESNFYAYSYADPNLYYTIHQNDGFSFVWEGSTTYVLGE